MLVMLHPSRNPIRMVEQKEIAREGCGKELTVGYDVFIEKNSRQLNISAIYYLSVITIN